jgi:hypothetical protein
MGGGRGESGEGNGSWLEQRHALGSAREPPRQAETTPPGRYVPPPQVLLRLQRRFRKKRMERFLERLEVGPDTLVLDLGGTPFNWSLVALSPRLVIVNIRLQGYTENLPGMRWVIADARRLPFKDQAFDVVFCNSVIEHLEDLEGQRRLANECRRVGHRYWVQTPNRRFPIEPHLMTPFIHWLPRTLQRRLLRNFTVWGIRNRPPKERRDRFMREVRLLNTSEMRQLFPDADIWHERVLGLSKSLVAQTR